MGAATAPAASKPIPGIREPPLLGSARAVQRDRLAFFARMATCGDIGRFHFGPFAGYFVNSPALIHAVLVERDRDFEKGWPQRLAFRPVTGDSILILEGSRHRNERQALAPAFQPARWRVMPTRWPPASRRGNGAGTTAPRSTSATR